MYANSIEIVYETREVRFKTSVKSTIFKYAYFCILNVIVILIGKVLPVVLVINYTVMDAFYI